MFPVPGQDNNQQPSQNTQVGASGVNPLLGGINANNPSVADAYIVGNYPELTNLDTEYMRLSEQKRLSEAMLKRQQQGNPYQLTNEDIFPTNQNPILGYYQGSEVGAIPLTAGGNVLFPYAAIHKRQAQLMDSIRDTNEPPEPLEVAEPVLDNKLHGTAIRSHFQDWMSGWFSHAQNLGGLSGIDMLRTQTNPFGREFYRQYARWDKLYGELNQLNAQASYLNDAKTKNNAYIPNEIMRNVLRVNAGDKTLIDGIVSGSIDINSFANSLNFGVNVLDKLLEIKTRMEKEIRQSYDDDKDISKEYPNFDLFLKSKLTEFIGSDKINDIISGVMNQYPEAFDKKQGGEWTEESAKKTLKSLFGYTEKETVTPYTDGRGNSSARTEKLNTIAKSINGVLIPKIQSGGVIVGDEQKSSLLIGNGGFIRRKDNNITVGTMFAKDLPRIVSAYVDVNKTTLGSNEDMSPEATARTLFNNPSFLSDFFSKLSSKSIDDNLANVNAIIGYRGDKNSRDYRKNLIETASGIYHGVPVPNTNYAIRDIEEMGEESFRLGVFDMRSSHDGEPSLVYGVFIPKSETTAYGVMPSMFGFYTQPETPDNSELVFLPDHYYVGGDESGVKVYKIMNKEGGFLNKSNTQNNKKTITVSEQDLNNNFFAHAENHIITYNTTANRAENHQVDIKYMFPTEGKIKKDIIPADFSMPVNRQGIGLNNNANFATNDARYLATNIHFINSIVSGKGNFSTQQIIDNMWPDTEDESKNETNQKIRSVVENALESTGNNAYHATMMIYANLASDLGVELTHKNMFDIISNGVRPSMNDRDLYNSLP